MARLGLPSTPLRPHELESCLLNMGHQVLYWYICHMSYYFGTRINFVLGNIGKHDFHEYSHKMPNWSWLWVQTQIALRPRYFMELRVVFTFRCQERNMTNQILVASPSILSMAPIEWHHHGVMVRISQETWTSWGCDLCIFLLLYWADRLGISLETHCAGVQLWTSRRKTGWVLKSHF